MNIEFDTPAGERHEGLLDRIKRKLIEFRKQDKQISRAKVRLRKDPSSANNCSCEIDLTIYGSSISVRSSTTSYERSTKQVMDELTKRVNEQVQKQRDPPDDIYSSVRV
jgi:ribosome-associated translation inhibitor RaiA